MGALSMTTDCQPLPQSVAEEMLQIVARALCDRPEETPAQRASRTRQMVHSPLGFQPRDGLEYMLSTLVVGHFHLIMDSMRDALVGQMDTMKARTKTTIVALDRSMLGLLKEMRLTRKRPLVTAEARRDAPPAERRDAAAIASEAPPPKPVVPAPIAAAPPRERADMAKIVPGPPPPPGDAAGETFEAHIAAFQDALASMAETLGGARATAGD
jgi:hypothetical protein